MPKKDEFFNGFNDDILDPDEFDETETEEETEEETEDDGKSEVKTEEETKVEDSSDSDKTDENAKTQEELEEEQKQKELHEKNEREKAKRLAREQKEREEREAKIKKEAKLEAELGVIKENTYTGEKITDEADLEVFKIMQEIESKGGDPLNDLAKEIATRNRLAKEEAKKKEEEANKEIESITKEVEDFHSRHKDITKDYLVSIGFKDAVDKPEYDGWSYSERVYDYINKYNSAKKESDDSKVNEIVKENGKKMTKVPSSNSNGGKAGEVDYMDMTDEEYLKREKEDSLDFF